MKWIRTVVCALGMLACVSLSAFAAEYGEPNITTKTTMKELRENPSIKAKSWLSSALAQADTLEVGHGIGPVHHFHAWW